MHMPCNRCICAGAYRGNNPKQAVLMAEKKERSLVKVLPFQGYAQQEVHPYALDQKAHYIVALISRSRLLNML